jgi:hypothetical protein
MGGMSVESAAHAWGLCAEFVDVVIFIFFIIASDCVSTLVLKSLREAGVRERQLFSCADAATRTIRVTLTGLDFRERSHLALPGTTGSYGGSDGLVGD